MAQQQTPGRRTAARPVRKAKAADGDWLAVYDSTGKLIGICDPSDVTRVSDAGNSEPAEAEPLNKQRLTTALGGAEAAAIAKSLDTAALAAFHQIRTSPRPAPRGRT
ncbi:hypothetical protein [Streptomyces hokutonensis]|uniref:hypothetical protein n=1 Tax=Streptomyces hokutonensis TaxID=1306990 RepID=UPI000376AEA5|nr:hypothetical protein [Streptomyces hokutonensis]